MLWAPEGRREPHSVWLQSSCSFHLPHPPEPLPIPAFQVRRAGKEEDALVFQGWMTLPSGVFPVVRNSGDIRRYLAAVLPFQHSPHPTQPSHPDTVHPPAPHTSVSQLWNHYFTYLGIVLRGHLFNQEVPLSLWSHKMAIAWVIKIAFDKGRWDSGSLRDNIYMAILSSHGKRNLKQL